MLENENLKLREIETYDLESIVRWRNDRDVYENLFSYLPLCLEKQKRWYENYLSDMRTQLFLIELNNEKKTIGTIGFTDIDYKNQNADVTIIIGEKDYRGKGYARQAVDMLLKYGFYELNLKKVYFKVLAYNTKAVKLYEKMGAKQEGILRKHHFSLGNFQDVIILSLFREDFDIKG